MEAILGEGMPWRVIMIFFYIGIWMGIRNGKKVMERDRLEESPSDYDEFKK